MKKIFIITGEYSGDIHASNVAKRLKELHPDIMIEGVGGDNLKSVGVKLFSDQKKMGAMGHAGYCIKSLCFRKTYR